MAVNGQEGQGGEGWARSRQKPDSCFYWRIANREMERMCSMTEDDEKSVKKAGPDVCEKSPDYKHAWQFPAFEGRPVLIPVICACCGARGQKADHTVIYNLPDPKFSMGKIG